MGAGKLGKTTQFYLENLVNLEKPISFTWKTWSTWKNQSVLLGFAWFYLVLLGFTWFCLVLHGFTRFYSEKPIGTEFTKLGQLGTEQCSWLSEKTSVVGHTEGGGSRI